MNVNFGWGVGEGSTVLYTLNLRNEFVLGTHKRKSQQEGALKHICT